MKRFALLLISFISFVTKPVLLFLFLMLSFFPINASLVGIYNLKKQLQKSTWHSHILLAEVFLQYFYYCIELFILWPLGLIKIANIEEFAELIKLTHDKYKLGINQGIVSLGGHYGNIEILGHAMMDAYAMADVKPFYALAKPSKIKIINKIFEHVRQKRGFNVLWTGTKNFHESMINVAQSGFGLALLVDQKPPRDGIFIPFFTEKAAFPARGISIAVEARMAFVHVTAKRVGLGKFELIFSEGCNEHLVSEDLFSEGSIKAQNASKKTESSILIPQCTAVLTQYAIWLQNIIQCDPGQWFWDYRKWSRKEK